jgi:hypothetical protein
MTGKNIYSYIPPHLDPISRELKVANWIEDVTGGFKTLDPNGWFNKGHESRNFIRTVPPAAAEVVVEQIGFARLKQPSVMHVKLVPHLMTGCWQRHLNPGMDGHSKVEDAEVWDIGCHFEPSSISAILSL